MSDQQPQNYVASEYDDGWWVEVPFDDDIEELVPIAGPFSTEAAAKQWIKSNE